MGGRTRVIEIDRSKDIKMTEGESITKRRYERVKS